MDLPLRGFSLAIGINSWDCTFSSNDFEIFDPSQVDTDL